MPTHIELDSALLTELAQDHGSPIDEAVEDAMLLHLSMMNVDEMLAEIHEERGVVRGA